MHQKKTDVVGTMRTNRKEFPDCVKRARPKKGETVAAFQKKQMIMKWKDKWDVVLTSTFHDDSMENVTTRQGVIHKPSVVLDYNKNMGGVDRNDGQLQETVTMLREAFKEALSQARVYEWLSRLKHGDMSLEDQPRSGRPSTSRTDENIKKIRDAMFDCHRTINELEALTGVSWSSCQRSLTEELHMKEPIVWMCAVKWKIKWKLIQYFCPKSSQEMNHGVMGTTWRQSNNQVNGKVHHLQDQKRSRQVKSNVKAMLICFFDIKGLIHFEFVPQGQTVNQQFYLEVLKQLCDAGAKKTLNCGGQVSGFCITTMLPPTQHSVCGSFSWKKGWQRLCTAPTPRTWHPAIFSCFQEWRGTLKESVFRM